MLDFPQCRMKTAHCAAAFYTGHSHRCTCSVITGRGYAHVRSINRSHDSKLNLPALKTCSHNKHWYTNKLGIRPVGAGRRDGEPQTADRVWFLHLKPFRPLNVWTLILRQVPQHRSDHSRRNWPTVIKNARPDTDHHVWVYLSLPFAFCFVLDVLKVQIWL